MKHGEKINAKDDIVNLTLWQEQFPNIRIFLNELGIPYTVKRLHFSRVVFNRYLFGITMLRDDYNLAVISAPEGLLRWRLQGKCKR